MKKDDGYIKKDNVLDILFALNKQKGNKTNFIKMDLINDVLEKIKKAADLYPTINFYDYPDLSADGLRKNKHVEYVTVANDIAYHMSDREATKLLKSNDLLCSIIRTIGLVEQIKEDLKEVTNDTFDFLYQTPNRVYELEKIDSGFEDRYNELYTDGTVKVLAEDDESKTVSVNGASYAIYSLYDRKKFESGYISSNDLNPLSVFSYLTEASKISKGLNRESYEEKSSHVLSKRRM